MDKTDARLCAKMLLVALGIAIVSKSVNCDSLCKSNHNACNNGTCLTPAGVCKCDPGYTGELCNTLTVNCTDEVNCTDNQVCVSTANSGNGPKVKCVCSPTHYHYADNCFARQCLSNPCVNGRCEEDYMNATYRYTCNCHNGYTGQKCETVAVDNNCNRKCYNGMCIRDGENGQECDCDTGYSKPNCKHMEDANNNCNRNCHNGMCIRDDKNGEECDCDTGYSKPNCKHMEDARRDELQMEPKQGPMAGGTLVMFKGSQSLIESVTNITIDGVGSFTILQNTNDEEILAISPSHPNGNDTKIKVIVEIELNGTVMTVITQNFTYKPNPIISNIFPRSLIQSARTSVTVIGTDLDAVGDPRLIITAVERKTKNNKGQFKSKRCTASKSGTSLICKAPKIPLIMSERRKRSFELADTKINILKRAVSRLRRQESDGEQDDIDFIFSLQLDGVTDYTDLTQNLPNLAYVDVNPDPTFEDGQIFYVDDGGESQIIGIKGENVDSGVVEDFTVLIGNASCSNIGLTNDKLYCYPPTNLLELGDNVRSNNEADVTVKVGETLSYNVGYVVYEKEETVSLMKVFVPVVAAIGGALLIVIIILIICACRKRRTKTEQKQRILPPPSATDIHNMTPGGNDNYYTGTDQSAAPNPYYMVVNDDRKQ